MSPLPPPLPLPPPAPLPLPLPSCWVWRDCDWAARREVRPRWDPLRSDSASLMALSSPVSLAVFARLLPFLPCRLAACLALEPPFLLPAALLSAAAGFKWPIRLCGAILLPDLLRAPFLVLFPVDVDETFPLRPGPALLPRMLELVVEGLRCEPVGVPALELGVPGPREDCLRPEGGVGTERWAFKRRRLFWSTEDSRAPLPF